MEDNKLCLEKQPLNQEMLDKIDACLLYTSVLSEIHKPEVLIHLITNQSNYFSHGKCRHHCSDSQSVDMPQDQPCHTGSNHQTDHIKRNLDLRIFHLYNL